MVKPPWLNWLQTRVWWLAACLAWLFTLAWPPSVTRLDLLLSDLLRPTLTAPPHSRVVAIDDNSLQAYGRWPWPRNLHAQLIDRLHDAGVQTVGYNVMFSEPATPQEDAALALALAQHPQVVLPVAPTVTASGRPSVLQALPAFQAHAQLGHVAVPLDADGLVRRLLPELTVGEQRWPAMPWAVWQLATPSPARPTPHDLILPSLATPVPVVSFVEAMRHPEALRGHTVFVGVTAQGLGPEYMGQVAGHTVPMPSPVLMAHAYEALRQQATVQALAPHWQWTLGLLLVLPVLAWPLRPGRWSSGGPALTVLAPLLLSWGLLQVAQLWFAPMAALFATGTALLAWGVNTLLRSRQDTQRLQQRAQATLAAVGEGVVVLTSQRHIVSLNPVARHLARSQAKPGQTLEQAFGWNPHTQRAVDQALDQCQTTQDAIQIAWPLPFQVGTQRQDVLVTVAAMTTPDQRLEGYVLALRDVTTTVVANRQLRHAATHDALTGLPNRHLLVDHLSQAIARLGPTQQNVAVLFIDLDRFKRINDSLGHAVGDQVLQEMAQRLQQACRPQDTVARWGGDEFVLLLEDVAERETVILIVEKLIEALSQDLHLDGLTFPGACSIGIAMAPVDDTQPDTLLAMADTAMYRAKHHPSQRWAFYSSELNRWTRDRLALESDAQIALANGEFQLHYQPQVELGSGQLVGFEALLRWYRSDGTLVPTGEFIATAEESQLILQIGEWTLREAVRQMAFWRANNGPTVPVSVNISARHFMDKRLIGLVRDILAEHNVPPTQLKLEITETAAMSDAALVEDILQALEQIGISIALDDFGTGYSSLVYLRRFPIQQIKIDQRFVRALDQNPEDVAIVRAIIGLAHGLGVPVVAEGVETPTQRDILSRHGCNILQGYLYAQALPATQATHWCAPAPL